MELWEKAWDAKPLKEASDKLNGAFFKYFEGSQGHGARLPKTPEDLVEFARSFLKSPPSVEKFEELIEGFLKFTHHLYSPHSMGHQVAPPVPWSSLIESLGALSNQAGAVFEMGPVTTAIERVVVEKLKGKIGWNEGGDGFATHGGTLANVTGLLAARNARFPKWWTEGKPAGKTPAILVGSDSHYSVLRAGGILGIGTENVRSVPVDASRKLQAAAVRESLEGARRQGREVFALVASAGSTSAGAIDPLDELADLAEREGLWFHIDGCHGASLTFSRKYRSRVAGIERGDSVVWDAHKLLYQPALTTYLFFKDAFQSYAAFRQEAPYLFDPGQPGFSSFDGALRTFECTKRSLALGLWGAWALFGEALWESLIDRVLGQTHCFWEILRNTPDFVPLHEPDTNILCFRYVPKGMGTEAVPADMGTEAANLSELQRKLRRALVEEGDFYTTMTSWDGAWALRVTVMNPRTEERDFLGLLNRLRSLAKTI